jgi:hypothetical protein
MEIVFYNQHQHGDIILSRQGIRWIIDHSPKNVNFTYVHNKHPESVFVHEKLQNIKPSVNIHCVDIQKCILNQMDLTLKLYGSVLG